MRVYVVPQLSDNYAYLVVDAANEAVAIDVAEGDRVLWRVHQAKARLQTVLSTHRHADHAGGNLKMAEHLPELAIVGGAGEGVPAATLTVKDGDELQVGRLRIKCIATPYHTLGHMCYLVWEEGGAGSNDNTQQAQQQQALFTGDALFVGGCGRNFQGTAAQMHHSLMAVLAKLPPKTQVYCGHEYTVANLEFAAATDPSNAAVHQKLEWAREQRRQGLPTVPSTIGEELEHNIFLRPGDPELQALCGSADEAEVLAALRRRKDNWGGGARAVTALLAVGKWAFGWTP